MKRIIVAVLGVIVFTAGARMDALNINWFDDQGVFHAGDPSAFLQKIHSGKIQAEVVKQCMDSLGLSPDKLDASGVAKLAEKLQFADTPVMIYPNDKKQLKHLTKNIKKFVKAQSKMPERGSLIIQSYTLNSQGPKQMLKASKKNSVLLFPDVPELIAQIPSPAPNAIELVDNLLLQACRHKPWKKYVRQKNLSVVGRFEADNLLPGPWIVWVNHHDILTYLYRIQIKSGETVKLNLNQQYSLGILKLRNPDTAK